MEPSHFFFGGQGATNASPISIGVTVLAGLLILFLRRKYVIWPFMLAGFLIPFGQVVVVAGLHFQMLRVLMTFGWVKIVWVGVIRKHDEPLFGKPHPVNRAFVYCAISGAVAFVLSFYVWDAFINQLGGLYNSLGAYFLLLFLIHDEDDVNRTMRILTVIGGIASVFMVVEQVTKRNVFGLIGGVPLVPDMREGRVRSQAFFGHSIIAGVFGACLLPLCYCLWLQGGKSKKYAVLGFLAGTVMTVTSGSSTPLMTYLAVFLAFAFWPLRGKMRLVRWGIVLMLIALHIVMHGPVWSLIAHIDVVGGNSADHRYQLVNQCILHFKEWWLIGTPDSINWGWDMWDTADTYVSVAERGGLITLIFFFMILTRAFRSVGKARAAFEGDRKKELYYWSLGAAVFTQCVAYFGISYFDQTFLAVDALLVMVVVLTANYIAAVAPETAPFPRPGHFNAIVNRWGRDKGLAPAQRAPNRFGPRGSILPPLK